MKKRLFLILCAILCLSCMTGREAFPQEAYAYSPMPVPTKEHANLTIINEDGSVETVPLKTVKLEKSAEGTRLDPYDQYRLTLSTTDTAGARGMDASVTATILYRASGFQYQLLNFSVEYNYGPSVYLLSRSAEYGARGNPKSVSIDGNSYSENVDITARSVGCRASAMAKYGGPTDIITWMTVDVWV